VGARKRHVDELVATSQEARARRFPKGAMVSVWSTPKYHDRSSAVPFPVVLCGHGTLCKTLKGLTSCTIANVETGLIETLPRSSDEVLWDVTAFGAPPSRAMTDVAPTTTHNNNA